MEIRFVRPSCVVQDLDESAAENNETWNLVQYPAGWYWSDRLGTSGMPPTPASPAPRTTPCAFVLGIEMQCLVLARDEHLKSECKTSGTQETPHADEALVGQMEEQESGKEDEEDTKCRLVGEEPIDPMLWLRCAGAEALDGEALHWCCYWR